MNNFGPSAVIQPLEQGLTSCKKPLNSYKSGQASNHEPQICQSVVRTEPLSRSHTMAPTQSLVDNCSRDFVSVEKQQDNVGSWATWHEQLAHCFVGGQWPLSCGWRRSCNLGLMCVVALKGITVGSYGSYHRYLMAKWQTICFLARTKVLLWNWLGAISIDVSEGTNRYWCLIKCW